jgi:hypothetical protein
VACRFWITSGAPPYTPATRRGSWTTASGEDVQLLGRKPQGSAGTSSISLAAGSGTRKVLLHRSISAGAVKAGTISGTVTWCIGAKESNALLDGVWHMHIYVTSGDSDIPRGTLLSNYTGATEFGTTAAGATEGAVAVSSLAIQVGDRLVVEIGYETSTTTAASYSATINYGNVGTTDLSNGDTSVTNDPGWVEFSGMDGLFTPSFSTLTDTFTSTIDAKWTKTTNVSATGGRARIPTTTTLEDLYTATAYEIQGGQVAFQVPTLPATGGGTGAAFSAYVSAGPTVSTTNLEITYSPNTGNLQFRNNIGGSDASPTTVTYNATSHAWWRFKETGGSILMETSPDNATWTTQRTVTVNAQWMRLGTLIFYCESQRTSGTADFAEIDNINATSTTTIAVGVAGEVETAQPIGRLKNLAVGVAGETETAQPVGRTKLRAIGVAGVVETAQPIKVIKIRAVGTAIETSTAQPVARTKQFTVGTATEQDAAQPVGRTKRLTLGTAVEVDTGQPIGHMKRLPVGTAQETSTAQPLGRVKVLRVGTAIEVSTARAVIHAGAAVRNLTFTVAGPLLRWTAQLVPGRWHADEQPNPWRADLQ